MTIRQRLMARKRQIKYWRKHRTKILIKHKEWYEKNKNEIYKKNKWRRQNDPEFRKRIYASNRKWALKNPEKVRARVIAWRHRHRKEINEKHRLLHHQPRGKYSSYKVKATERGLVFSLAFEEFHSFWQKPCWYCLSPIKTIGLDRIDNKKGYQMDNIIPCCSFCNRAKMQHHQDKFILMCNRVAKLHPII